MRKVIILLSFIIVAKLIRDFLDTLAEVQGDRHFAARYGEVGDEVTDDDIERSEANAQQFSSYLSFMTQQPDED